MSNVTTAIVRRVGILIFALMCYGALPASAVLAQQSPEQQGKFLPLDKLPPAEQLPAGRLLVGAYAFVIVGLFLYVVSVARRLTTVQREVERLEADVKRTGRA
jgi:CcmD family protein